MRAETRPQGFARRSSFRNNCGKQLDERKTKLGAERKLLTTKIVMGD